jgi:hypothetical protein
MRKALYPYDVIPGLQACPGMIEAGGIHWLFNTKMDSCWSLSRPVGAGMTQWLYFESAS